MLEYGLRNRNLTQGLSPTRDAVVEAVEDGRDMPYEPLEWSDAPSLPMIRGEMERMLAAASPAPLGEQLEETLERAIGILAEEGTVLGARRRKDDEEDEFDEDEEDEEEEDEDVEEEEEENEEEELEELDEDLEDEDEDEEFDEFDDEGEFDEDEEEEEDEEDEDGFLDDEEEEDESESFDDDE